MDNSARLLRNPWKRFIAWPHDTRHVSIRCLKTFALTLKESEFQTSRYKYRKVLSIFNKYRDVMCNILKTATFKSKKQMLTIRMIWSILFLFLIIVYVYTSRTDKWTVRLQLFCMSKRETNFFFFFFSFRKLNQVFSKPNPIRFQRQKKTQNSIFQNQVNLVYQTECFNSWNYLENNL